VVVRHVVESKLASSHSVDEWQVKMDVQSTLRYIGTVTVPSKKRTVQLNPCMTVHTNTDKLTALST
jgi:hypothetical protein